jgi:L-ascorbate metabolism protein UlaG (beta-lactamase superfamily)
VKVVKLTKYTHACVRLEGLGGVLVIDPGIWTEPEAVIGADAVLVTHEHADHVDRERLAALGVPVFAPAGADIADLPFIPVASGDSFVAAGFTVLAVGERHAFIYDGEPDCANLGYLVDGSVYHPGDSLHVPLEPVDTLLVPAQGSWLKMVEAIDFMTTIAARRVIPIHDGQLNAYGLESVDGWLGEYGGSGYRYLAPGESLRVDES